MSFTPSREVASSSSFELLQLCRQFTISEILVATEYFDESLVIGRGGFGKVYKGTMMNGASVLDVAIKRLDSTSNQGALEFWAEVKMLSKVRHCHLVSLIGYCHDEQDMILVYEYMSHGTLEDHLHKRGTCLPWLRRIRICIGAARGLDYLHTGTGIEHGVIHRDVKSSNILLHKNWAAKVSDFGLSKISPINQLSTGVSTYVKGTFGYLDPHYYSTGKLTRKSDVYAFGVVLLEVLCGKRPVDSSIDMERWGLAGWAQNSIKKGRLKQIIDNNLVGRANSKCLKKFARLADQCLHSNPKQRPTMAEVVLCLESILALQGKANDTLQHVSTKIFGRKVGELSVDKYLKPLDIYLCTVGGENRMLSRFDFSTLNLATKNFSNGSLRIDMGDMYKGRLQNGQEITIINILKYKERMMNEVSILLKLDHENLFSVLGYCIYAKKLFLVYRSTPYTTLTRLLRDTACLLLDWNKRYKILLEVARVLLYLHKHAPIRVMHLGLGCNKILLDESLDPKLSSFGIAKCSTINETDCIEGVGCGVQGYIAPEVVIHGHLSCKADVYSFGVVVLETISGIKAMAFDQETHRPDILYERAMRSWLEGTSFPIDPRIVVDISLMTRFVEIGLLCIQEDITDRPTMEEVIDMLLGGSSPTLLLSEIRGRKLFSVNDYDVGAVEESISDLYPR